MPAERQLRSAPAPGAADRPRAGGGDRVLLIEDEPSVSEPFSHALAREGFVPVVAPTAADARAALSAGEPDIVLLDLMLPDADGRDVGLELGADDYVVKPFVVAEVIARIRAVLRRSRARAPRGTLSAGEVRVDMAAHRAWRAGEELSLTRKEFDLLARLLRDPGHVVTREDLMNDVWDENWFGST